MAKRIDQYLIAEVQRVLAEGRLLDVPCGGGGLSRGLAAVGYEVTPADLFPESLDWPGSEATLADMNQPLPFPDATFDGILSQEGVEHLENLPLFFRECRRVLRAGGHLWLTTPNFMDLSGRTAYFLAGMKSFHSGYPNEESTAWGRDRDRVYHGHAFTLPFFQIRYLLRVAGFDDIQLHGLDRSNTSCLLYPILYPLTRVFSRQAHQVLAAKQRAKPRTHSRVPSKELQRELERLARSRALLCHKKICVRATAAEQVELGDPESSDAGVSAASTALTPRS